MSSTIGSEAREVKGWLRSQKWLVLRRLSQIAILTLFLVGPLFGIWIVKGNLTSSLTLNVLPLTDPFVLLQSVVAGQLPYKTALIGAAIVTVFYLVVGGRMFCSWVCPMNMVTDAAAWLRARLGIKSGAHFSRMVRYWILAMLLIVAFGTGSLAWELINPVSMIHRALIFGIGAAWTVVLAVFLLDTFVSNRAWCGHLCPAGAFYSLLAKWSALRVIASKRAACNDCMDCFAVCPEPQVIRPALKAIDGASPAIVAPNCTNCGRCIDVCSKDVFVFGARFSKEAPLPNPGAAKPAAPIN